MAEEMPYMVHVTVSVKPRNQRPIYEDFSFAAFLERGIGVLSTFSRLSDVGNDV